MDRDDINGHADFLLRRLEVGATEIRELCEAPDYFVKLTIWYVGEEGFSMEAEKLSRLASLCNEVRITCWGI